MSKCWSTALTAGPVGPVASSRDASSPPPAEPSPEASSSGLSTKCVGGWDFPGSELFSDYQRIRQMPIIFWPCRYTGLISDQSK